MTNCRTQLVATSTQYKVGDEIQLEFIVHNLGSESIRFCYWQCPLEGTFSSNYLHISRDNEIIPYKGIMIKRKPPGPEAYAEIPAGQNRSILFAPQMGYPMDKPGHYCIQFIGGNLNQLPDSGILKLEIE